MLWSLRESHTRAICLQAIYILEVAFYGTEARQRPAPQQHKTDKMVALPQYNYIFAFGTIFSFLDAWNIGKKLETFLCTCG